MTTISNRPRRARPAGPLKTTQMSKHTKTINTGASKQVRRPAAPAVIAFIDAIEAENRNSPGKAWSRVSVETIMEFVDAAQNYYESGVRAAAACRNALVGGLAGGAVIGTSLYGLISYIRRRRNERRNSD